MLQATLLEGKDRAGSRPLSSLKRCPKNRDVGIGGGGRRPLFSRFAQICFVRFETVFNGVLIVNSWYFHSI